MSIIASNGTGGGMSNVGTSWTGGVVPVEGDSVTIMAADIITVTGAHIWGDDTTTAITVNGKLSYSRTVSSSLTVKGGLTTAGTITANIDIGTTASPIATVTADLILNYSAAMATYKYGMTINDLSNFTAVGNIRQTNTRLSNAGGIAATATSMVVDDCTGWLVGGQMVISETDGNTSHEDVKVIATITLGAGTVGTITWIGGTTYAHAQYAPVGYFSSNVTIKSFNPANDAWMCMKQTTNTAVNGRRTLTNVSFQYVTSDTSDILNRIFAATNSTSVSVNPYADLSNLSWYSNTGSRAIAFFAVSIATPFVNSAFYCPNAIAIYLAAGCAVGFTGGGVVYKSSYGSISEYSQGGQGCYFTNFSFWATGNFPLRLNPIIGGILTNVRMHSSGPALFACYAGGPLQFINCSLGSSDLPGTPTFPYIFESTGQNALTTVTLTNTKFGTPTVNFVSNVYNVANSQLSLTLVDKNGSTSSQEIYTNAGILSRDNTIFNKSTSSVRVDTFGTAQNTKIVQFLTTSGTAYTVIGYIRKNSTYGALTLPSVSITGLGITPVTFTMTNSVDTWEKFTLVATQTSGASGNLTFTFNAQSAISTGKAYLDGVVQAPFIGDARHYSFLFDKSVFKTVNTIIQQTVEATVGAYTGITINHGTQTITVSSNHSVREIYDYCYYNLCQTVNLAQAEFFTSTDGINFSSTYNLILSGGSLTGTGNINLGTKVLTRTTETSTLPITYNSGANVFGNISISGLVVNSRVRLNNTSDNIELYNSVVAATSVLIPATWSTNKTLDLRVTYVVGAAAKLNFQSAGTLTSTLAAFTVSQVDDTIYIANAIDGSTITEFITDYPNIQVDIQSASGVTSIQRLYAWFQYATHTAQGIVYYFNGVVAQDTINYKITVAVVNLLLDNTSPTSIPCKITGAYLFRDDGTTVIFSGSKSIQLDPSKAYIANSTQIQNMVNLIPALL